MDLVPIHRALISVSDKTGILDLARELHARHVELISTGGTARALRAAGLPVQDVASLTGFAEMLDGRVKTLHPVVHAALLARREEPAHMQALSAQGIAPIDLVIVNLYPFEQTIAAAGCTFDEAVENIDIGGPSMIRSAAKNHAAVAVVTDVVQYAKLLKQLQRNEGGTDSRFRLDLAMWAFRRTAEYDSAIHAYLARAYGADKPLEPAAEEAKFQLPALGRPRSLRYGENPHQEAAFVPYANGQAAAGVGLARQLHGKELSYINLLDADAALALVLEFSEPAAAVIKHANPCGCGTAASLPDAFEKAYNGDAVSAFGGIVAFNRPVDLATARQVVDGKKFLEVLVAPEYMPEALELLRARWKEVRILATGPVASADVSQIVVRSISGGLLVQQADAPGFERAACTVASQAQPTPRQWQDLAFAALAVKHVKSNAIAVAAAGQLLGAGAGQTSRVTACRLALELARQNGHGASLADSVAASDAFFPFPDGPEILITGGVRAIVQPGGSRKDGDTIDLCNRNGVALVLTGVRHFRH